MEILISNKTLQIEQPGIGPICRQKKISRTRARLQTRRQSFPDCVRQACLPCRDLRTECDRCLRGAAFRISPIKAVLHQHHGITKAGSPNSWCARNVKVIRHHRNEHRQIEIALETPSEIEIAL